MIWPSIELSLLATANKFYVFNLFNSVNLINEALKNQGIVTCTSIYFQNENENMWGHTNIISC